MSDISHIQLGSDGEVYDIKDASAIRGIKINGSDVIFLRYIMLNQY